MLPRVAGLAAALVLLPAVVAAQSASNVLLVINEQSPASIEVGEYYAAARKVPARNVVRIKTADQDQIDRDAFTRSIEVPLASWIARHKLQDQILYIVLTKGVPLRVAGTSGTDGTVASVDSELTLLYRRMAGAAPMTVGRVENPYFLGARPLASAQRFTHASADVYLVTRLDGFTVADVKALIDRGLKPVRDGHIVLDQRAVDDAGDRWLREAATRLTEMKQQDRVTIETTRAVVTTTQPVLGYFSWGSNDPANQRRKQGMSFVPGAIGGMFVSTDARTFREPGAEWKPAPAGATTGGQALIGDLIREGITGVTGNVFEPYLDSIAKPQVLFPAYLSGFNLAESFYLAMPFLSWQQVVIGDPLCAPFMTSPLADGAIHQGVDPETDLPRLFSARRLASLSASKLNPQALKLMMLAQSLDAQDRPDAEVNAALEKAASLEPKLTDAQLRLAAAAENRKDFDHAVVRYRAILAVEPNHIVALNNLAYLLADRKNQAKEALPLAERAYQLSGQAAVIADTLGWVHYKLGDAMAAMTYIDRAAKQLPKNAEITLHLAELHLSLGNQPLAKVHLDLALKLDPSLSERDDVKALVARIR